MGGACRCSAAVCDRRSRRAARAPRDSAMVRAGPVGTHLPTSSLDIFGDLRKMNKRQVTEARVGGAPGAPGPAAAAGVGASPVRLAPARAAPCDRSSLGSDLPRPTCGQVFAFLHWLAQTGEGEREGERYGCHTRLRK